MWDIMLQSTLIYQLTNGVGQHLPEYAIACAIIHIIIIAAGVIWTVFVFIASFTFWKQYRNQFQKDQ